MKEKRKKSKCVTSHIGKTKDLQSPKSGTFYHSWDSHHNVSIAIGKKAVRVLQGHSSSFWFTSFLQERTNANFSAQVNANPIGYGKDATLPCLRFVLTISGRKSSISWVRYIQIFQERNGFVWYCHCPLWKAVTLWGSNSSSCVYYQSDSLIDQNRSLNTLSNIFWMALDAPKFLDAKPIFRYMIYGAADNELVTKWWTSLLTVFMLYSRPSTPSYHADSRSYLNEIVEFHFDTIVQRVEIAGHTLPYLLRLRRGSGWAYIEELYILN